MRREESRNQALCRYGSGARVKRIEFFKHGVGEEETERVAKVLNGLFLTTGEEVAEFERAMAAYLGLPHAIAVTSCTAAMHLAWLAAGIGPGDEVITTPLTFIGTANSVLMAGATPVLADIERSTGNIDASAVAGAVTERTRGILPVHLYGQMCDMDALRDVADRHGLVIVEDAAHSLESRWNGKRGGHYGDYGAFSFYATKSITAGEGGIVTAKDDDKSAILRKLRLHGLDRTAEDTYTTRFEQYDVSLLGWKYNMDNIHAAILIEQLKKADAMRSRRGEIYNRYVEAFSEIEEIELHSIRPECSHSYLMFTILVDPSKRVSILEELQDRGIGVSVNFHPLHLFTYYRERFGYKQGDFPVAEEIGARTITLPLYPKLPEQEIEYVIETVTDVVRRNC
jgi:dTDP-4-amino-4,6-dideoxygalactose transaminase